MKKKQIAIIGAGPAGLIAAQKLVENKNYQITIFDRMASPARKFLMAGQTGLNLTNTLPLPDFLRKYRDSVPFLEKAIQDFTPKDLIKWAEAFGEELFEGTSGRIFPKGMKASKLTRAWRGHLEEKGVRFVLRHRWSGWNEEGLLTFESREAGDHLFKADACLLALGGVSWPHLGSDGNWLKLFKNEGLTLTPFKASNCGFVTKWTDHFIKHFEGLPLKSLLISYEGETRQGDLMLTKTGIEGGPIYALSAPLRDAIETKGKVQISLDLHPDMPVQEIRKRLSKPRGGASLSTFLKKTLKLSSQTIGLLREVTLDNPKKLGDTEILAKLIKGLPLSLYDTAPIEQAISCAGGVKWEELDKNYMLQKKPGIFLAGEMIDWDAPTGGFLLQACFSTGAAAAKGMSVWLDKRNESE